MIKSTFEGPLVTGKRIEAVNGHAHDGVQVRQGERRQHSVQLRFLDRDSKRTFEQRHAIVHHDPLVELKRRMAPWAVCPQLRGQPLDAQIVPIETLDAAIAELHMWRKLAQTTKPRELWCATNAPK